LLEVTIGTNDRRDFVAEHDRDVDQVAYREPGVSGDQSPRKLDLIDGRRYDPGHNRLKILAHLASSRSLTDRHVTMQNFPVNRGAAHSIDRASEDPPQHTLTGLPMR
jgi:hypothetical protein